MKITYEGFFLIIIHLRMFMSRCKNTCKCCQSIKYMNAAQYANCNCSRRYRIITSVFS